LTASLRGEAAVLGIVEIAPLVLLAKRLEPPGQSGALLVNAALTAL
jgi:hypothetical protein